MISLLLFLKDMDIILRHWKVSRLKDLKVVKLQKLILFILTLIKLLHGALLKIKKLIFLLQKSENKETNLEVKINKKSSLSESIILILDDSKVENLKVIDLTNKSSIADSFIIATCRSTRHANATADDLIRKLKKIGIRCPNPEGKPQCDWVIVDAGQIIVHLFRKEIRELYNLEKLWEINFDSSKIKLAWYYEKFKKIYF